ncbi:uncharacterized protein LOC117779590 [Drosophila innubila]|uniref:Uncharacterized protein LOC117564089 n=1 Tax=Drosophila albomicans TaxID=7291 RepID=A0A6P8WH60_DROAB|nr:uncharacterized protein LOC117564089 [Drosophila albomicans]XP_034098613.1 uncharacterized protein LOC117564089 [Drosophila albomicans]XP_034471711.1 uncharacterized protein LOC117779590 [Drosophila innubila]XP_034471712.1 uncharacterized protein LOC117779590 [Drosophila innubila]XP_060664921.1 uncharacterized protein LOC132797281 [Drosophila nasuta]XP_062142854.1 uncharacterized protein LOC133850707 [Drosophila sulfurigaster albostrigata]XP_062142855.1 uncharacterized protein LOC133850707
MKECSSRSNWCLLSVVIDQRLRIDTCRYLIEILSRRITGD